VGGTCSANGGEEHRVYKVRKEASMESRFRSQRGVGVEGSGVGL
jgi:hypothetical protein